MKRILRLICSIFFIAYSSLASAQAVDNYLVHFDKEYYFAGEEIFFKAYSVFGVSPLVSNGGFSAALYDSDGKLLQNKYFALLGGAATGSFLMQDSVRPGVISFSILDGNGKLTYRRNLQLLGKELATVAPCAAPASLQFYAEGGNLIAGLTNMIVIKSVDKNGMAVAVTGAIKDAGNQSLIDSFYTDKFGLGKMNFFPIAGKKYIAEWQAPDKSVIYKDFLSVQNNGLLLHAEAVSGYLYLNIMSSLGVKSGYKVQVSSLSDTADYKEITGDVEKQSIVKTLLAELPNGYCVIYLRDNQNNLLQRRLFFNPYNNPAFLTPIKKDFSPKGLNYFRLNFSDTAFVWGSLAVTDYSVSELSGASSGQVRADNIASTHQLIQSGDNRRLDLLLCTLSNGDAQSVRKVEQNALRLVASHSATVMEGIRDSVMVVLDDSLKRRQMFYLDMAPNGTYYKENVVIFGPTNARYQYKVNKDYSNNLLFKSVAPPVPEQIPPVVTCPIITEASSTLNAQISTQFQPPPKQVFGEMQTLKELVVERRKINPQQKRLDELDQEYASGLFAGGANTWQFNVIDDPNKNSYRNIQDYIRSKIPSIVIENGYIYYVRGFGKALVPVFVNEMELDGQDGLSSYPIEQIAYIKFKAGIVIGSGFVSSAGALFIYLKKGTNEIIRERPTMRLSKIAGYDIPGTYTFPDYSKPDEVKKPDRRTTLYWNTDVSTNTEGKIDFEFYNNDISKKFVVTFWGVTDDGRIVHFSQIVE